MPQLTDRRKRQLQDFWDRTPCGSSHADAEPGSQEFFAQVEAARARLEPFIDEYAQFDSTNGLSVLEIGIGLGTDFLRFARAGATATGIDLTPTAVALVEQRLAQEHLDATVCVADAEDLPFASNAFDVVYSWGVLHHTPNTARAIDEAHRVLRPGGRLCVMLYGRYSWVSFALWIRYALFKGRPRRTLSDVLANHMESAGTKGYTRTEFASLFRRFDDLEIIHVATPYDRRVAGPLARLTSRALGWFVVIQGTR